MRTEEEIREELARLDKIIDDETYGTTEYYRSVSRYWAIRWVMEWEKEIPE